MSINLRYDEKVAILDLGDDENRFSPVFLDDIDAALNDVIDTEAQGLVTTAARKFYTNGLDTRGHRAPGVSDRAADSV